MGFAWEYDKINLSDSPVDHKIVIRKFPYKIIPIQIPCINTLAILVTVLHMMNMREDYLIHNTHRTFRA